MTQRQFSSTRWLVLATMAATIVCASAMASPAITNAVMHFRKFNDDPGSTITFGKTYPSSLWIKDAELDGVNGAGWANRHNFRLSENGFTDAYFNNGDGFSLFADVTITGPANSEGGLELVPWWDSDTATGGAGGQFMLNATSGEIACFSGRLPFYSFTANYGLTYTKGETVRMGMIYNPHSLSAADPGTMEYVFIQGGTTYTSGPLAFDEGNAAEGYGTWGMLDSARVGGYFQPQIVANDPSNWGQINWANLVYTPEPSGLALLGVLGLGLLRRR